MSNEEFEKVKLEFEKGKIDIEKFSNASKAMDTLLKAQIQDKIKRGIRYHATPPPYNNNYIPPTSDLVERQVNEELPIGASDVDPLDKITVETDDSEEEDTEVRNKETIPLENQIITNENGGRKFIRSRNVETPRNEKKVVLPKNIEKVEQNRKRKRKCREFITCKLRL